MMNDFLREADPFQRKMIQHYTMVCKVLSLENTSKVLSSYLHFPTYVSLR